MKGLEAPPKPMEYTSNAGATAGRLIMIVVDANNIGAGRAIETVEADKIRFIKYADAYAAAKGSQQALVDQWRKYIESQR